MKVEKIRVDTTQLQKDKNTVKANLKKVERIIKSIYDDVAELDAMWDGSANEAFKNQFQRDYVTINEILRDIEKYIEKMSYAKNKYENCENAVSEIISKIKVS